VPREKEAAAQREGGFASFSGLRNGEIVQPKVPFPGLGQNLTIKKRAGEKTILWASEKRKKISA